MTKFSILLCFSALLSLSRGFGFRNLDPKEYYEDGDNYCRDVEETSEDVEYETTIYCYADYNNTVPVCPDKEPVKACHTMYQKKCDISFRPRMKKVHVRVCPGDNNSVDLSERERGGYRNNVVIDVRPSRDLSSSKSTGCVDGKRKICVTNYETECSTVRRKKKMIEDHPKCRIETLQKCDQNNKCRNVPSMKCKIEKRQVTKVKPETSCRRVPRNFCRKVNCAEEAEKKCYYRIQMVNEILPEEKCTYRPQRVCHEIDHEEEQREKAALLQNQTSKGDGLNADGCYEAPVQKCERRRSNPKTVLKKMKKKICTPKSEVRRRP